MTTQVLENRQIWHDEFKANWLAHYEQTGETNWKVYNRPRNEHAPTGKGVDLSKSRLVLITSAGSYLADSQQPYDAGNLLGDYTIRVYPSATPLDKLAYAHEHYDHTAVNADAQVLIPLRHLEDMVAEGIIGEVAPNVISYHGYQPDATRTLDETIPAIREAVKAESAHAALLVPS